MKSKNILTKTCLLFIFCCISVYTLAQTNDSNNKELLLGKWVIEKESCDASLLCSEGNISIGLDNVLSINIFSEIEIKQDIMSLLSNDGKTQDVKYKVNGNYINLDMPSKESIIEWVIVEDKLYIEYNIISSFNSKGKMDDSAKIVILSVYKRR